MPLYEYRCSDCDESFEVLQRMGAGADGLSCPSCGASRVEREVSTFASLGPSQGAGSAAACAPGGRFT